MTPSARVRFLREFGAYICRREYHWHPQTMRAVAGCARGYLGGS